MKYLFLTKGSAYFPSLTSTYHGAGVYNWPKAMDGEIRLWAELRKAPEQILNYDVIHINLAGDDIGLAAEVAPLLEGTSIKLVINCDYSINYMDKNVPLFEFLNDIRACDRAFGVEPGQANLLNFLGTVMGTGHKTMLLPHPIDMDYMSKAWLDYDRRQDALAFHYHKYDGHLDVPWLICDGIEIKQKVLFGYTGATFDMKSFPGWTILPFSPWDMYLYSLKRCKYGFEYRTHKAASRFIMEAAALGIPTVSTDMSFMGWMLFPELCNDFSDFTALHTDIKSLVEDDEFRLEMAKKGMDRVQDYDFGNSKKNMERLLE